MIKLQNGVNFIIESCGSKKSTLDADLELTQSKNTH